MSSITASVSTTPSLAAAGPVIPGASRVIVMVVGVELVVVGQGRSPQRLSVVI